MRNGRMDVHLEFKNASKYQAQKLFTHFYLPGDTDADSVSVANDDSTAIAAALATLSPADSDVDMLSEKSSFADSFEPEKEEIQELADQFSRAIPEYEFSMASLQGYLMGYKTRPFDAVEDVAGWVNAIQTLKENKTTREAHNTSTPTPPLTPANVPILLKVPGQDRGVMAA
jgi:chaperone BCS1